MIFFLSFSINFFQTFLQKKDFPHFQYEFALFFLDLFIASIDFKNELYFYHSLIYLADNQFIFFDFFLLLNCIIFIYLQLKYQLIINLKSFI